MRQASIPRLASIVGIAIGLLLVLAGVFDASFSAVVLGFGVLIIGGAFGLSNGAVEIRDRRVHLRAR